MHKPVCLAVAYVVTPCCVSCRNLQSPAATQHVLVLYFSVRHHLRRGGPHFSAYEHWFAALIHTGTAEWLVPLKRNSDFDTTTEFDSIEKACAHVAKLRRAAGGAPLPSGPTAAGWCPCWSVMVGGRVRVVAHLNQLMATSSAWPTVAALQGSASVYFWEVGSWRQVRVFGVVYKQGLC